MDDLNKLLGQADAPLEIIPFTVRAPSSTGREFTWRRHEDLHFYTADRRPFQLHRAYNEKELCLIQGGDVAVLEGCGNKISLVIHPEGQPRRSTQKTVNGTKGSSPLAKIARKIAEVVEEYIEVHANRIAGTDDRWRIGEGYIEFADVYLVGLKQISKASFEPILASPLRGILPLTSPYVNALVDVDEGERI